MESAHEVSEETKRKCSDEVINTQPEEEEAGRSEGKGDRQEKWDSEGGIFDSVWQTRKTLLEF